MHRFADFAELQAFVRRQLCSRIDADSDTPMLLHRINRHGESCGVEFTLFVGRTIRLSAIWDAWGGQIHFYDTQLARFQTVPSVGPDLADCILVDNPNAEITSTFVAK